MAAVPGFRTIGSFVGRPLVRGRDPMGVCWPDSVTGGGFGPGNASALMIRCLPRGCINADSGEMRGLGGIGALRRVFISLQVILLPIGGNLGVEGGIFLVESPWEASGDGDAASSFSADGGIRFLILLKDLGDWKAGSVFKAVRDGDEGPSLILPPTFVHLNWSLFGFHAVVKEHKS